MKQWWATVVKLCATANVLGLAHSEQLTCLIPGVFRQVNLAFKMAFAVTVALPT